MSDPRELAAVVRAQIRSHPDEPTDVAVDLEERALAALDALVAECERWREENDVILVQVRKDQAALEEMRRERDAANGRNYELEQKVYEVEARARRYEEALREIVNPSDTGPGYREIARAALAEEQT